MIYSKANLLASVMASKDGFDGALNGLRLNEDGSTVAGSKRGLMVVSPVVQSIPKPRVVEAYECGTGGEGKVLELAHVEKVLKNISKDKRAELQHCALTADRENTGKVELTTWDRAGEHRISYPPKPNSSYPNWQEGIKRVVPAMEDEGAVRICVDRRELIHALKALGDACPDRGDWAPVWLQVGNGGMLLRAQNDLTNQTAMAVVLPHEKVGGWLKWSRWERGIWKKIKKIFKRK